MKKGQIIFGLLIINTTLLFGQTYSPEIGWKDAQIYLSKEKSAFAQERMEWWRKARYGMFIHWNPSSLSASEISWSKQFYEDNVENQIDNPRPDPGFYGMKEHNEWLSWFLPPVPKTVYDNLYKSFYPAMFDAEEIVKTAKNAGMKYIIMVSKHHDGFCMWDSEFTDYDIMSTPFNRDILGEMAIATRKAGLKFGIYYSQRDWHHPDYTPETMSKYNTYMKNQLRELLTKYGEISVLFFDAGEWKTWELWEGDQLFKMAYELQPNIIINDRCGVPGDYSSPEQKIGLFNNQRNWESCMTFTGFWSWHGFQTPVIPYENCLKNLIRCAGGDGNLLMNIGPMPTGQIDPREVDRLNKTGNWLKKYGESIYNTNGGPFLPDSGFVCTYRDNEIFLFVFKRNSKQLILPVLEHKIVKAELLDAREIAFIQTNTYVTINMLDENIESFVSVVKLTLENNID
jgi:alpha-L-fucosidase